MRSPAPSLQIPALIEIDYRCRDIWNNRGSDPDDAFVQFIEADVRGSVFDEETDDREEIALGQVGLARIDLLHLEGEGQSLADVFDCHSSEWINSYEDFLFDKADLLDEVRWLVIADRMQLLPEARGQGLGLHVLARALRTWASDETLIVLVASSTEVPLEDEAARRAVVSKLARHWSKLGFERLPKPGHEPVLYALSDWVVYDAALQRYSERLSD